MKRVPEQYTRMQVPGLAGVYFRDLPLQLQDRQLSVYAASAADVLSAPTSRRITGETPYWCVAWPAGLGLARYLAALDLAGTSVLEVGCGVGISALGALAAGAKVLATDNEPHAMRLTAMNARRNRLPLRAAVADWRAWPLRARFDRIIGSDVTYAPPAFEPLLAVLDLALAPGGEVLLTDPGRLTSTAFQKRAIESGWRWETITLPREGPQPVFLYRLWR